jgi:hypothetical protein
LEHAAQVENPQAEAEIGEALATLDQFSPPKNFIQEGIEAALGQRPRLFEGPTER